MFQFLLLFQDLTLSDFMSAAVLLKLTHFLYQDCDVLEEETILRWHKTIPKTSDNQKARAEVRKKVSIYSYMYVKQMSLLL